MTKQVSILVVEDENKLRRLIVDILGFEGITALGIADGCEAQRYLEEQHEQNQPLPHIIVLDRFLPCMNGPDLFQWLTTQTWSAEIAVVFTTATAEPVELPAGALKLEYLAKPYQVDDLLKTLRSLAPTLFAA